MKSRITGGETDFLFSKKVLNKYDVGYYRCRETGFIQTEEPYWLNEAYASAISSLDVGLVRRNLFLTDKVSSVIYDEYNAGAKFLDYGGGYGLFVRLMRDKGFDYYLQDLYAPNLFARFFGLEDLPHGTTFELLTAFEVFEHLDHPVAEFEKMLQYSKNIMFTTELQPDNHKDIEKWWYFVPETGQHVAFYNMKTLQFLAEKYRLNLYSNGKDLHLLTAIKAKQHPLQERPVTLSMRLINKIIRTLQPGSNERVSLTGSDFTFVMNKLNGR